jgi:type 1 fimbriae regulatory protein FimE
MSTPRRKRVSRKSRDYLRRDEVRRLLEAALDNGRYSHRNYTLILLCYRHALRISELRELRWRMIDFKRKVIRVKRTLNGINSVQPLRRDELTALRKLKRDYPGHSYLFISRLGKPMSEKAISRVVAGAGRKAKLRGPATPSMLRRGCGHALAEAGHSMVALQHYLGHRNIRHTLRYFDLPDRPFKDFWKD